MSMIWDHFTRLRDTRVVACNHCSRKLARNSSIDNLIRHLFVKHPEHYELINSKKVRSGNVAKCRYCHRDISSRNQNLKRHLLNKHPESLISFRATEESASNEQTSSVWKHFVLNPEKFSFAKCRYCRKRIVFTKRSKFGLERHMMNVHPDILESHDYEESVNVTDEATPHDRTKENIAESASMETTSSIWKHFVGTPETSNSANCRYCHRSITFSKRTKFALKQHMMIVHPEILESPSCEESVSVTVTDETTSHDTTNENIAESEALMETTNFVSKHFVCIPQTFYSANCRYCRRSITFSQRSTNGLRRHLKNVHPEILKPAKKTVSDQDSIYDSYDESVAVNVTYKVTPYDYDNESIDESEKDPPKPPKAEMSNTAQNGTEKYHLKWHSHNQNINQHLSNLYKNDRYADVMLLTCNGEENYTIPAHKLILGSSSLYFANIFDKTTVPTNAVTYIVLPPDLTYRSMQVLIQYMYTGESTVTNDILNEVLRGGELLKIRGLWRTDSAKSSGADGHPGEGKARFVSPVTVTMPAQTSYHQQPSQSTPLIQVKRDVAIDPAERLQKVSLDGAKSSRTVSVQNQEHDLHRQDERNEREDHGLQHRLQITLQEQQHRRKDHEKRKTPSGCRDSRKSSTGEGSADAKLCIPQELSFLDVKEEPVEWSDLQVGELSLPENGAAAAAPVASKNDDEENNRPAEPGAALRSEGCVEFPFGSTRSSTASSSPPATEQPKYSPLTCELCIETFTIPSEWVRHIEGHSEMTQNQPKRRRRMEEATDETAALRCDLCATFYVTPADWVRHVQNAHTERELAASNNRALSARRTYSKKDNAAVAETSGEATSQLEKLCNICNKTFPSSTSMATHRRTHTGEKPFLCELCNKDFNVKSNLHRHMRTVHNQQDDMEPASSNTDRDSCSSD